MSPEVDFAIHLLVAALGSYVLVLLIKRLLLAIDKGLKGKLTTTQPWQSVGEALDELLPILPAIPAGVFFMLWPVNLILPEPFYQFLAGAAAGSMAANLYELVKRMIRKRVEKGLSQTDNT